MKKTVGHYRDAQKNSSEYFSKEKIENNMIQYFTGLQYTMELITGLEWHWSYDGKTWSVISIDKTGKEKIYLVD